MRYVLHSGLTAEKIGTALVGESDHPDDLMEAWIGPNPVEHRLHFQVHEETVTLFHGLVEQLERLFLLTQADVKVGKVERRDVASL